MDIVYLFKESIEHDSVELRYSLRSLANIPHGGVYIVGEKPAWATNVMHIPVPQTDTKAKNVGRNLQTAENTESISEDFIMMNDDFFFMKQHESLPVTHWGYLKDILQRYTERYGEETEYMATMRATYELLLQLGYPEPLCYELHTPMQFNKYKLRQMRNEKTAPRYQLRTMYGNRFDIGGTQVEDVKIFVDPRHNDPEYERDPAGFLEAQSLLSATGGSFDRGLVGRFVRAKFPDKSPYEL